MSITSNLETIKNAICALKTVLPEDTILNEIKELLKKRKLDPNDKMDNIDTTCPICANEYDELKTVKTQLYCCRGNLCEKCYIKVETCPYCRRNINADETDKTAIMRAINFYRKTITDDVEIYHKLTENFNNDTIIAVFLQEFDIDINEKMELYEIKKKIDQFIETTKVYPVGGDSEFIYKLVKHEIMTGYTQDEIIDAVTKIYKKKNLHVKLQNYQKEGELSEKYINEFKMLMQTSKDHVYKIYETLNEKYKKELDETKACPFRMVYGSFNIDMDIECCNYYASLHPPNDAEVINILEKLNTIFENCLTNGTITKKRYYYNIKYGGKWRRGYESVQYVHNYLSKQLTPEERNKLTEFHLLDTNGYFSPILNKNYNKYFKGHFRKFVLDE